MVMKVLIRLLHQTVKRANVNCSGQNKGQKYLKHFGIMDFELAKEKWIKEEVELKKKLICYEDDIDSDSTLTYPLKIGGADLSFYKDDFHKAVCCYVVLEYQSQDQDEPKMIYKALEEVELKAPYIPGFLTFRESNSIITAIKSQMESNPDVTPDFIMIDGNGIWHPRKFGIACHIGVEIDVPTLGVAKNYYSLETHFSDPGEMTAKKSREDLLEHFKDLEPGQELLLKHPKDDSVCGLALRGSAKATKPVFVSVGHKISLLKAKNLTLRTTKHKVPEPIRQADIIGREQIRKMNSISKA